GTWFFEDTSLVITGVHRGDRPCPVGRDVFRTLEVLAIERAIYERGEVREDQRHRRGRHTDGKRDAARIAIALRHLVHAEAKEDRGREYNERRRASGTAQRKTGRGTRRKGFKKRAQRRWTAIRMRSYRNHDADE